jgi:ataxin-3
LESIALDLDMKEQHLLEGQEAPSGNVDSDGNYSVQVLIGTVVIYSEALRRVGEGLAIEPIFTFDDYSKVSAYLCHSDAHWFGLRQVRGIWYNLNSTLSDMPNCRSF